MKPIGFRVLAFMLAIASVGVATAQVSASAFPSRAIRVIVPYAPGGNTDIVARVFGQKLSERVGQPVVFDNRGGATGTLGVGVAAKSPNDGYTLVIGDLGSMVIANHAIPNRPYDPIRDFAPVALVTSVSIVLTVNPKSTANNFDDILRLARAQPARLTYGTSGIGSPSHLAMELVQAMTGTQLVHVPFKGGAQAVTALIGEQIDMLVDGAAFGQVKAGRLKAVAVTGPRLPALPEVAGIGESVKGFEFTNWWGFLAPAGTPPDAISRLNEEFRQIAGLPEIRERLSGLGLAARAGTPQQFAEHLQAETEKIGRIVRSANIRFE